MTVLTAVLKLAVEDIAPLRELLIWDSEVLWVTSTDTIVLIWVLTDVLRLAVPDAAVEPVVELPWAAKALVAMPIPCSWLMLSSSAGPCPAPRLRPST